MTDASHRRSLGLFLCAGFLLSAAGFLLADTIKLKDGSLLEGTIRSENSSFVVIDVEIANATITKSQTVPKEMIVEVRRLTDEEKAQRQMERDFKRLQDYKLSQSKSFALQDYDKAIREMTIFLTTYETSPYRDRVQEFQESWQYERNKVASGLTKVKGSWLSAEEVANIGKRERAEKLLQQAKLLGNQDNYSRATEVLKQFLAGTDDESIKAEFRPRWLGFFTTAREDVSKRINLWEWRLRSALDARIRAERNLDETKERIAAYRTRSFEGMGVQSTLNQYAAALESAQAEVMRCESTLVNLRQELLVIEQSIARLPPTKTHQTATLDTLPMSGSSNQETKQTKPMWERVWTWCQSNSIASALIALLGVSVLWRLFTR